MVRLNPPLDHPFCPTRPGPYGLRDPPHPCRRAPQCVHKMMLDHYQQTKNLLVSYSPDALGFTSRVDLLGEAADLLRRLSSLHGLLLFHQSGGCCDGSSPMCFPVGDFITSEADVHLADLVVTVSRSPWASGCRRRSMRLEAHAPDRRRRARAGKRPLRRGAGGRAVSHPARACSPPPSWPLRPLGAITISPVCLMPFAAMSRIAARPVSWS